MSKLHLFTGATGFVGGAMVLELLRQTDDQIACIVRPRNNRISTQAYLEDKLCAAARAYGWEDLLSEIPSRCRAISGDILLPSCGEEAKGRGTVSEVWHCAASLEYRDSYREQIFQHNIYGTKNTIALARSLKAKNFNYISTAYVAGSTVGHVFENLLVDTITNNCYEQSKREAEKLVDEIQDMHLRLFRPSIVIGHSKTYAATSFSGLYGFIREVNLFKYRVSKLLGSFLNHRRLRIRADENTPVNFIPVDMVAANAVRISYSNSSNRVFHLTNGCVPSVAPTMNIIFKELGVRAPWYVSDNLHFTSLDEQLDESLEFYNSYLRTPKTFDQTNVEAALGSKILSCPLDALTIQPYISWYVNKLTKKSIHNSKQGVGYAF